MNKTKVYFTIQLKRFFRELPAILCITLCLLLCIGALAAASIHSRQKSDDYIRVKIAIVGNTSDSYLGIGISALSNLDTSKYEVELLDLSLDEAKDSLQKGDISMYLVLPENFIDGISTGSNPKVQMVTDGANGIGGLAADEIAWTISYVLNESQTAIYTLQNIAYSNGIQDAYGPVADNFFLVQMKKILSRESVYDIHEMGIDDGVTLAGYYFCSIFLLFIMLWGITCSGIFCSKKEELKTILYSKGIKSINQTICELGAYFLLMFGIVMFLILLGVLFISILQIELPSFAINESMDIWMSDGEFVINILVKFLPAMLMIACFQQALYEITDGILAGVLTQFMCFISLGYICGCFYPSSYFPIAVQKIANITPIGMAKIYCESVLSYNINFASLFIVIAYSAVFLTFSILIRNYKIKNGK